MLQAVSQYNTCSAITTVTQNPERRKCFHGLVAAVVGSGSDSLSALIVRLSTFLSQAKANHCSSTSDLEYLTQGLAVYKIKKRLYKLNLLLNYKWTYNVFRY